MESLDKTARSVNIGVIGGGFASLSAACYLAKAGYNTTIYEKHDMLGGRARCFEAEGFTFDMGPSWYWMPDTFERFFEDFGFDVRNLLDLDLLDPGFRIYYGKDDVLDVPANQDQLKKVLEELEPGSADAYDRFMQDAEVKYRIGMQDLVETPCLSPLEFCNLKVLKGLLRMQLFTPFDRFVKRYFRHDKILRLMEFPVLFLGASPDKTPALYSLMNYAGLKLGTWYPQGGMHQIVKAMEKVARALGVQIAYNSEVKAIESSKGKASRLVMEDRVVDCDIIVSGADYHHTEQHLLSTSQRNYSPSYWERKVMAPSSLLFYLGVDRKVDDLQHHNLFFDTDFATHAHEIYDTPKWPSDPLFYVCCPSKTDSTVAPEGSENLFILMPIAAGIDDDEATRARYFDLIMDRLEDHVSHSIRDHVVYSRSYCVKDFVQDYHAYRGNAYGLANTLRQTAILKPRIKNKTLPNLFYTGQLSVPGPGVPPSLISGKVVASQIMKEYPLNLQQ